MNQVTMMGRLVRDPELRTTQSGKSVASFTLAVDRPKRKDVESVSDFLDVVVWRQTADFVCKYFAKGSRMAVVGRMKTRTYQDKDGNKRKAVEIVAENVYFADSKKRNADAGGFAPISDDDENPFN